LEDKMNKLFSIVLGIVLIGFGLLALAGTLLAKLIGISIIGWPLIVVAVGLAFVIPPFLFHESPGLSGLFIPGLPILATGGLLFVANTFHHWGLWGQFWPVVILALALAFVLMGIFLRIVWMAIPASIIGLNGLVLLACALTGRWELWAVLWTAEPLSLGLAFLFIGLVKRMHLFTLLGLSFSGFALVMGSIMSLVAFSGWWLMGLVWPAILIVCGGALVAWTLMSRPQQAPLPVVEEQAQG
jgi:hypothetical protein